MGIDIIVIVRYYIDIKITTRDAVGIDTIKKRSKLTALWYKYMIKRDYATKFWKEKADYAMIGLIPLICLLFILIAFIN